MSRAAAAEPAAPTVAGPPREEPLVRVATVLAILGFVLPVVVFALAAIAVGRRAERRIVASRGARTGVRGARRAQRLGQYGIALGIVALVALFCVVQRSQFQKLYEVFFEWEHLTGSFDTVLTGFWWDVRIFLWAELFVLVWALLLAIMKIVPGTGAAPLRWFATVYVDVFRGIPAIVTIALVGFGLPIAGIELPQLPFETWFGSTPRQAQLLSYGVLALTIIYGAYVAEVYRAGIESVHWSQTAASRSLGLSWSQTMGYVVVPQAVRRVIPPLLNDFIALQKDAALVFVIGITEGYARARIYSNANLSYAPLVVLALLYLCITIPLTRLTDWLVKRDEARKVAGS